MLDLNVSFHSGNTLIIHFFSLTFRHHDSEIKTGNYVVGCMTGAARWVSPPPGDRVAASGGGGDESKVECDGEER